jgi:hypothetical protein
MFCDLLGSTTLSGKLDARDKLDSTEMHDVIQTYRTPVQGRCH